MWETWVQSLGWEDPLEEDMAIHSSILAWRILMDRRPWWAIVHGVAKSQTWLKWLSTAQQPEGLAVQSVGPKQNEYTGFLTEKLFRTSRWWQQGIKLSARLFWISIFPCDCLSHTPTELILGSEIKTWLTQQGLTRLVLGMAVGDCLKILWRSYPSILQGHVHWIFFF